MMGEIAAAAYGGFGTDLFILLGGCIELYLMNKGICFKIPMLVTIGIGIFGFILLIVGGHLMRWL